MPKLGWMDGWITLKEIVNVKRGVDSAVPR